MLGELAPRPGERVLDLYAGVGLFALALADAVGPTGAVLAIEGDARACEHARDNLAGRGWASVAAARVEDGVSAWSSADLVVLDPPRTGAGRAVIDAVCRLRPRAIAYVACDPAALARDVALAAQAEYQMTDLAAFDLFPMTQHVECVATFTPVGPPPD